MEKWAGYPLLGVGVCLTVDYFIIIHTFCLGEVGRIKTRFLRVGRDLLRLKQRIPIIIISCTMQSVALLMSLVHNLLHIVTNVFLYGREWFY